VWRKRGKKLGINFRLSRPAPGPLIAKLSCAANVESRSAEALNGSPNSVRQVRAAATGSFTWVWLAASARPLFALAVLSLSGCSWFSSSSPIAPSSRAGEGATMDKQQAAEFTDIPIPAGARMDLDRTLVLGPRDNWIGRLVYTSAANPNDLFEFYARELPRFGWAGITAVRAGTSVLSFTRGERVATVQISRTTLGGSEVLITISPRTGSSIDATGGAPRAPVTPQPLR
jgi:hypothetical protein